MTYSVSIKGIFIINLKLKLKAKTDLQFCQQIGHVRYIYGRGAEFKQLLVKFPQKGVMLTSLDRDSDKYALN